MRLTIIKRGLATLLLLMAVAVILILTGATTVGFTFGLVVAGMAGVLLVSTVVYDVVQSQNRPRSRERYLYRTPHARGF